MPHPKSKCKDVLTKRVQADTTLIAWLNKLQPPNRETCRNGPRPCPHLHCAYHLYYQVLRVGERIELALPNQEVWEMENTCTLDRLEQQELPDTNHKGSLQTKQSTPDSLTVNLLKTFAQNEV